MKKLLTIVSLVSLGAIQHAAAQATPFTLNSANYTQNFDTIATGQTSSIATAAPGWSFWRSGTSSVQPNYSLSGNNTTAVTQNAGTVGTGAVNSSSSGGAYLWVSGTLASGTDKSIGFLTTGSYPGTTSVAPGQTLALLFGFTNTLGNTIDNLALSWNYERYREGTRTQGWEFYSSSDGVNWVADSSGNQAYSGTSTSIVYNPPESIAKSVTLNNLNIANGQNYYLRWSFVTTGSWSNSQGLGVDDISMQAGVVPEPSTAVLGGLGLLVVYFLLRRRKTS
jgi:hypothetical protein